MLQKCQSILLGIGLGLALLSLRTVVMVCSLLYYTKQVTLTFEKREIMVGGRK